MGYPEPFLRRPTHFINLPKPLLKKPDTPYCPYNLHPTIYTTYTLLSLLSRTIQGREILLCYPSYLDCRRRRRRRKMMMMRRRRRIYSHSTILGTYFLLSPYDYEGNTSIQPSYYHEPYRWNTSILSPYKCERLFTTATIGTHGIKKKRRLSMLFYCLLHEHNSTQ